jgi:RND family efflux transporter MFP subunit
LGAIPDLVLAAYRVGDSPMNVITPLNVYLAVMVGFAQKYQKECRDRHHRRPDAALHGRPAGRMDSDAGRSGMSWACPLAQPDRIKNLVQGNQKDFAMPPYRPAVRGLLLVLTLALGACKEEEVGGTSEARPVRTVLVAESTAGETVTLSGTVESQLQVSLAFRIGGRLIERPVGVGDTVTPGQVIARLDAADEENALRAAEASRAAAAAQLGEAQANYDRQRQLFDRDVVSLAGLQRAEQTLATAQGAFDAADAQTGIARQRLADTVLVADAGGVVTEVGAEPGEVVSGGRPIVQLSRDVGKDAVFDVPTAVAAVAPPDPVVEISLSLDPSVVVLGRIREVAPRADPSTGTIRVRVGLIDPPEAMRLGSTINGRMQFGNRGGIEVPASALTASEGAPALWVVDPSTSTVALRPVEVTRFAPATVGIGSGVEIGERVVTAGVQALRPGQEVRLLGNDS